jgi:hypothetical protein
MFRRSGSLSRDQNTYERGWRVHGKDSGTGATVQIEIDEVYDNLPVELGDTFPGLDGVILIEFTPTSAEDHEWWEVTARYEIPDEEPQPDDFNDFMSQSGDEDNTSHGPKFSYGGQVIEEYPTEDLADPARAPLMNSARDPIPLPMPVTIQVERVTVNQQDKPDTSTMGICQGRKLLANVSGDSEVHVNKRTGERTRYYVVSYEVWTHPYRDWTPTKVWDAGFNELIRKQNINDPGPTIRKEPMLAPGGEQFNDPQFLDGIGKKLSPEKDPYPLYFTMRRTGNLNVPFLAA